MVSGGLVSGRKNIKVLNTAQIKNNLASFSNKNFVTRKIVLLLKHMVIIPITDFLLAFLQ